VICVLSFLLKAIFTFLKYIANQIGLTHAFSIIFINLSFFAVFLTKFTFSCLFLFRKPCPSSTNLYLNQRIPVLCWHIRVVRICKHKK
jgi:hypothetical protein